MATKKKAGGATKGKRPSAFKNRSKGAPRARKPRDQRPRVNVELIKPDTAVGKPIFSLIARTIEKHHPGLVQARVAAAWNLAWKADADGVRTIGKLRKASELDRELNRGEWDFVILLSKEWWETCSKDAATREKMHAALIDHELCHITERTGPNGEPMKNERGRRLYRTRKHDIAEFSEIVYRHGPMYKGAMLQAFNAAYKRHGRQMVIGETARPDRGSEDEKRTAAVVATIGEKGKAADKASKAAKPPTPQATPPTTAPAPGAAQ